MKIYILILFLFYTFSASAQFGLKDIFSKKKPDNVFNPTDTSQAFRENRLFFGNIGHLPYYYDAQKIELLNRYQREQDWEKMYFLLYEYVCRFGIDNFYEPSSLDLLWQLARVSEYLGKIELTKDIYRYLIKHYRGDLQQAVKHYDSLTQFDKDLYVDIAKYYELIDLRKHIDTLVPPKSSRTNLGDMVNSPFEEYGLTISLDEKTIWFTSRRTPNEIAEAGMSKLDENIYHASKISSDTWGDIESFSHNTHYNEGSPCMSADGKSMYFVRCHAPESIGDCDIYVSYRLDSELWSEGENLGSEINSIFWDSHPAISVTGDTLFFSSSRKGGFGGTDLYFSVKKNGQWEAAQNMGAVLNTKDNEVSPFVHPINNVLYFSSDGHIVNFGDFDIYKSYFYKTHWIEPKNIGPLVNGKGSEFYFAIDFKAKNLYYAKSEPETPNNLDLFALPLPMEAQPSAIVKFSGKVVEKSTGEIFEGMVSMIDLDSKIEISPKYIREDGTFEFELMKDKNYMIIIQGENFFRIEEIFFLEGDKEMSFFAKNIKDIRFASLEFELGKADILPQMENDLHLLIDFLVDHPDFSLSIEGHTDLGGDPKFNLELSQKRASNISKYIVEYGKIDPKRITAIGKGSTEPLIERETSEEDKKINRRVAFKIQKTD